MSSFSMEFGATLSPKLEQSSGGRPGSQTRRLARRLLQAAPGVVREVEICTSVFAFALMMILPLAEVASRTFLKSSIGGTIPVVEHLSLWITFLGAALAARSDRLLSLATPNFLPERVRPVFRILESTHRGFYGGRRASIHTDGEPGFSGMGCVCSRAGCVAGWNRPRHAC